MEDAPKVEQGSTEQPNEPTPRVVRETVQKDVKVYDEDYVTRLRNESAERRIRAKELEEQANTFKSEAEQARSKMTEIERRALRLEVALEKGLTPAMAKRLVGDTYDDLVADADDLLRDFTGRGGQVESPQGGRTPVKTPDLNEQIAEAERNGDLRTAMILKAQAAIGYAKSTGIHS